MNQRQGANIEIRAARTDEMKDLDRLTGYAFANNEEPKDPPEPGPLQPDQTLCAFDDDTMVATSGAFPFKMRFNGQTAVVDGVTMVSADPGYRRRGIVRQLITGLLHRSKENGVPISILWASMGAIYQRFGYGLSTSSVGYDIHPRYVQFQFGEPATGTVRLMSKDDALPLLQSVYRQYATPGSGMLHRAVGYWEIMLRRENNQHTRIAVYMDAAGEPRGYCLYRTEWLHPESPEPSQRINVFDLAWLDTDAYRGIWEYLGAHDLVNRIHMEYVAEDDPAPGMLLEPRMLQRRTWDGVWMRIVDAETALSARGYDAAGEVSIAVVEDDLCEWNNGRYRITSSGAATEVSRLGDGDDADIVTRPDAFASLISGYARPSDLHRMGRLTLSDESRGAELDQFFSTRRRPTCPNMF